jgi:hypothetical protein
METLNKYPKITKAFLRQQWYTMESKEDWQRRTKWLKNKYKWIK